MDDDEEILAVQRGFIISDGEGDGQQDDAGSHKQDPKMNGKILDPSNSEEDDKAELLLYRLR
jgi:hypothetical protein